MKNKRKATHELAKAAISKKETIELPQAPSADAKKRRKKQEFIGGAAKDIKLRLCPKTYKLIRWWCKSTRQFIGTFIQNAVTDAFIKEITHREEKIKVMEKYYSEYFEDKEQQKNQKNTLDTGVCPSD